MLCRVNRPVSDEAALAVAGMILIDVLTKERMYVYGKIFNAVETREETLNQWQKRWVASGNAKWAHMPMNLATTET